MKALLPKSVHRRRVSTEECVAVGAVAKTVQAEVKQSRKRKKRRGWRSVARRLRRWVRVVVVVEVVGEMK